MGESDMCSTPAMMTPAMPTTTAMEIGNLKTNKNSTIRRVKRRSNIKKLTKWLLDNQIGFSFNLLALLYVIHSKLPQARPYTSKFFLISHYNPKTKGFAVGIDDFYFLGFCIVLFTGLRASCMKYILAPLARRWGISKKKDVIRFTEQAWLLCYYSVFWTLGVYIYCTSKYFLNLREMFTDWPTRELPELTKTYILGQWAFWLQQLIVIKIEERRKDHWQMFAHHIVTIVLISTSYALHLVRVANLILVLMDVVDIFFPLAKCLKYLGFTTLRDIMFGIFMLSWFLARHVFYLITMWSIYTHMADIILIGCYHGSQDTLTGPTPLPEQGWSHMFEPFWNPSGTICYSDDVRWGFLYALGFLQLLTVLWFYLIVKVAIRVVRGFGADDIRSDEEGEEGEEEEEADTVGKEGGRALEVTVEVSDLKAWKSRVSVRKSAGSSGVSLPGHGDRKELLGRIGCEKQLD